MSDSHPRIVYNQPPTYLCFSFDKTSTSFGLCRRDWSALHQGPLLCSHRRYFPHHFLYRYYKNPRPVQMRTINEIVERVARKTLSLSRRRLYSSCLEGALKIRANATLHNSSPILVFAIYCSPYFPQPLYSYFLFFYFILVIFFFSWRNKEHQIIAGIVYQELPSSEFSTQGPPVADKREIWATRQATSLSPRQT